LGALHFTISNIAPLDSS